MLARFWPFKITLKSTNKKVTCQENIGFNEENSFNHDKSCFYFQL